MTLMAVAKRGVGGGGRGGGERGGGGGEIWRIDEGFNKQPQYRPV